ncbi:hypothetical protein ER308_08785 [Egibacter rhizosphaerae]|uniref:PepSY domain-containing protein n=1 Tax=Egibacter rhizosphaerae TaxID=1670831 RepID=A0A411YEW5_9ACTN|nr:hypothetical protein [Egibacter rhizosphaerae]QBI19637.1 hypothetical protein ER308_08785 [Egibacter rhizosphaerae]
MPVRITAHWGITAVATFIMLAAVCVAFLVTGTAHADVSDGANEANDDVYDAFPDATPEEREEIVEIVENAATRGLTDREIEYVEETYPELVEIDLPDPNADPTVSYEIRDAAGNVVSSAEDVDADDFDGPAIEEVPSSDDVGTQSTCYDWFGTVTVPGTWGTLLVLERHATYCFNGDNVTSLYNTFNRVQESAMQMTRQGVVYETDDATPSSYVESATQELWSYNLAGTITNYHPEVILQMWGGGGSNVQSDY